MYEAGARAVKGAGYDSPSLGFRLVCTAPSATMPARRIQSRHTTIIDFAASLSARYTEYIDFAIRPPVYHEYGY